MKITPYADVFKEAGYRYFEQYDEYIKVLWQKRIIDVGSDTYTTGTINWMGYKFPDYWSFTAECVLELDPDHVSLQYHCNKEITPELIKKIEQEFIAVYETRKKGTVHGRN